MREGLVNIWIVNPYGTLPSEGWREYRSAQLARSLAERGHQVTWWIANFEHRSKAYRKAINCDPLLPKSVTIRCLPTPPYKTHISIDRIRFEQAFGREFGVLSQKAPRPDAIVLAEPSLFFGVPVRKFAKKQRIPLIIDVIDLWPELFHILLPPPFKPLGKLLFAPLYARRRRLARQAVGIAAVTADYRDKVASGLPGKRTGVFYLGVDFDAFQQGAPDFKRLDRTAIWDSDFTGARVVYAGTLGEAYDIGTVCEAVRVLCNQGVPIQFIFAGDGPLRAIIEELANEYPSQVHFAGSLSPDELVPLYRKCDIGLCSYAPGSTVSMPMKIFDYLAAGLAVLSSLEGEINRIVKSGIGLQYSAGSSASLVDAISSIVANGNDLDAMKAKSLALGEQFDSERQYVAFAEFIETVVA